MSVEEQLKNAVRYEKVKKAVTTGPHNTVCSKCEKVCHQNCSVPFTEDNSKLLHCLINSKGTCRFCFCQTISHDHVRIGYEEVEVETPNYTYLAAKL